MGNTATMPQIEGLPPGSVVMPIGGGAPASASPQIEGLPPGSVVTPIASPSSEEGDTAQPPTPPADPSRQGVTGFFNDVYTGAAREAVKSIAGIDSMVSKIPGGVGKFLTTPLAGGKTSGEAIADEKNYADQPSENVVQSGGGFMEQALEFFMGDEALQGLSLAEKLRKVTPAIKAVENSPKLAAAVKSAIRTGAVSGGQTLAKTGGDVGESAKAAAIGAGVGGLVTGAGSKLGQVIKDASPTVERVGGEDMVVPRRPAVPQSTLDQQAAGQRVITSTAKDAAGANVDLVNDKPQIQMDAGPNGTQGEPTGGTTIPKPPIVDVPAAVARVQSFGDAADEVEAAAKRSYEVMDASTNGQFTTLRDQAKAAAKDVRTAISPDARDLAQARLDKATANINRMFEASQGDVSARDWQAANSAWRSAKTLRLVHDAVESTFDTDAGFSQRSNTYRGFNGTMLRQKLNRLTQTVGDAELNRVIGQSNMDNLRKVAEVTRTNADRAKFGGAVQQVSNWLTSHTAAAVAGGAAGAILHGSLGGLIGATGTEAAYMAARKVMQMVATNPQVGKQLTFAVESGARPAFYAPLIGKMIRDYDQQPAAVQP